jgi:hypothetical protein
VQASRRYGAVRCRRRVGNAADPRAQVITAARAGSAAAIAINADRVSDDVAVALQTLR